MLSPLLFVVVMDAVYEEAKKGLLFEILYADNLVLIGMMANSMAELRE